MSMMQPDLDDALRMVEDLSWDDLLAAGGRSPEEVEKAKRAAEAKRAELAGVAARVMSSPDGERLFKFLCDVTLFRPGFVTTMGFEPMQAFGEQCRRDGQCALISQLLKLAAEGGARDAPAAPSDPEKEDANATVSRKRVRPVRAAGPARA